MYWRGFNLPFFTKTEHAFLNIDLINSRLVTSLPRGLSEKVV